MTQTCIFLLKLLKTNVLYIIKLYEYNQFNKPNITGIRNRKMYKVDKLIVIVVFLMCYTIHLLKYTYLLNI